MYHLKCYVTLKRDATVTAREDTVDDTSIDDPNVVQADLEIINIVRETHESDEILNMKNLNTTYNNLLGNTEHINYKRYLKTLISLNVENVVFSRPKSRRESELVCSQKIQESAIQQLSDLPRGFEEYKNLFDAASMIRKDLLKLEQWLFEGDYENYSIPDSLSTLVRWIIVGPKIESTRVPKNGKLLTSQCEIYQKLSSSHSKQKDRSIMLLKTIFEHRRYRLRPLSQLVLAFIFTKS